jgi:thiol-disulfide isomerase/thioredoxin
MASFTELKNPNELIEFLNDNPRCLVTFSATWCGPCKAGKPKLQEIASSTKNIPFGYVYESDLEDYLDIFIEIKSFPTYVLFKDGQEVQRVEGVDFAALETMLADAEQ